MAACTQTKSDYRIRNKTFHSRQFCISLSLVFYHWLNYFNHYFDQVQFVFFSDWRMWRRDNSTKKWNKLQIFTKKLTFLVLIFHFCFDSLVQTFSKNKWSWIKQFTFWNGKWHTSVFVAENFGISFFPVVEPNRHKAMWSICVFSQSSKQV